VGSVGFSGRSSTFAVPPTQADCLQFPSKQVHLSVQPIHSSSCHTFFLSPALQLLFLFFLETFLYGILSRLACSHVIDSSAGCTTATTHTQREMARRQHLTLTVLLVFFGFLTFTWFMSSGHQSAADNYAAAKFPKDSTESLKQQASSGWSPLDGDFSLGDNILKGGAIAPKLGNETAKCVPPPPRIPQTAFPPRCASN
jgi:hypothetical protein